MKRRAITLIVTLALACSACADNKQGDMMSIPPKQFDLRNALPEICSNTRLPFVKLKDNLVLEIPPIHGGGAMSKHCDLGLYDIKNIDKIPYEKYTGFVMYMPNFTGISQLHNEYFDVDRIGVLRIEPVPASVFEPDAPGGYPPNMFKRISTGDYRLFDPDKFVEYYGLKCYKKNDTDSDDYDCYGLRDVSRDEYVLMRISLPPYSSYTKFPLIDVRYASKRYGGVQIIWQSHASNFKNWLKIDQQIWANIDKWNIAPIAETGIAPRPQQP